MFGWFERRIDPYPMAEPTMPPAGLFRFVLHYSRGAIPWLVLLAIGSAIIALIELTLFGWLGTLIDRLADTPRDQFWAQQGGTLALMAVVLLIFVSMLYRAVTSPRLEIA